MEEKNMKKATIRDVAKAAGVSQSTVSRVLNNNGYVGEDARRRVEEAMEALHYSPSAIAVCLSKSRSRMIGVIVPQIFAPFFSQMYYIADRIMERYGYRLLLCNSDESLKREKELIDDLLSYKIAALLIVPVDGDEGSNKEYLDYIRSSGTPVVCVDREIEGIHCDGVYIDNYTACYEVTKDVLTRGYRNIAYMADPPIYRPGCDRLRGFRDACKEFGVTVPQENIFLAPIEDTRLNECILYRNFEHGEILDKMAELMNAWEQKAPDLKEKEGLFFECANGLVETAGAYGFSGNLWHCYLTFLLVNNENAFSTACEIRGAVNGSINELALNDFGVFKELYDFDLTVLDEAFGISCCKVLGDYTNTGSNSKMFNSRIRDRICDLSKTLAAAESTEAFHNFPVLFQTLQF